VRRSAQPAHVVSSGAFCSLDECRLFAIIT
jgi:hypothetical protein